MAETMATPEAALAAALHAVDDDVQFIRRDARNFPVLSARILAALSSYSLVPTGEVERLREDNERLRGELDGARRWVSLIVRAAGGVVSVSDSALAGDTPDLLKSYDPRKFLTTFRATLTEDETDR